MKKKKKEKAPLSLGRKLVYALVTVAVVCGLSYLAYYLVHYTFYREYENYLTSYVPQ